MSGPPPKFRGVSDLREFFRTNQTPIYFISPTAFNLLGIDRWVRNFHYVNYFDSFDGGHPNVFVPTDREAPEFSSIEDICNYLLRHREVTGWMKTLGPGGRAVFVMFDEQTESLAASAGLRVAHPPAAPGSPARSAMRRSTRFSAWIAPAASSQEMPWIDAHEMSMSNSSAALVGAAGMKPR